MCRELEVFARDLAKQIKDSAADISPKHLHTGYEFGPVQQWLDFDIIAAARHLNLRPVSEEVLRT